ncbi:reverse transcriptase domain-containing protein [Salibacter halophilus]|uniref:Reverse transcriptase domain-containing protein n=1 Tax=Salibacter halophilus TaxID=1803916 RepID=A0A6N6M468_9FLAO|nr:reverse transcriptase domain-containing protein [Salibacter halophilus]KAB1064080.1 hypothetical protein F3059_08600 [Salibacter halophilus]
MMDETFDNLWEEFVKKEFSSLKKRKYKHFDYPITFSKKVFSNYSLFRDLFTDKFKQAFKSKQIFDRGYYPFIHYIKYSPKFRNKKDGSRVKSFKKRHIYYSSHLDSIRLSWFALILGFCYEQKLSRSKFSNSVKAYRKFDDKLNNVDFAIEAFQEIATRENCVAVCLDISKFFDNIPHKKLKKKWLEVINYEFSQYDELPQNQYTAFKVMTNFHFVEKDVINDVFYYKNKFGSDNLKYCSHSDFRDFVIGTGMIQKNHLLEKQKGIPQGAPISAILSNIVMIDFDKSLFEKAEEVGGKYYRYSDDILLIINENDKEKVKSFVSERIEELGFKLNDKKERVVHFKKLNSKVKSFSSENKESRLQYLGLEFDGEDVFIRSSTLSRYHGKMKKGIKRAYSIFKGKNGKGDKIFKSKLHKLYTNSTSNNFIKYAHNIVNNETILNTNKAKNQISARYKKLNERIND